MEQIIQEYIELHKDEISEMKKKRAKETKRIYDLIRGRKRKEYYKQYYQDNKEQMKENAKIWRNNNIEYARQKQKERRKKYVTRRKR